MSEKTINITIPKYHLTAETMFIYDVCENYNFDYETLISLILADWIATFQLGCSKSDGHHYKAFLSYLESTKNTRKTLEEIKKYVEEQEKNNNDSH